MFESMVPQRRRRFVAEKEIAVKKYVVKLSDEEREQLNTLGSFDEDVTNRRCSRNRTSPRTRNLALGLLGEVP
jgi:hypothetical protein